MARLTLINLFGICYTKQGTNWHNIKNRIKKKKKWHHPRLKILFWLQGLFWTNSTKSSPLVYILPLTNIFQRGYFVKFGGKSPLAPLYFEPWHHLLAYETVAKLIVHTCAILIFVSTLHIKKIGTILFQCLIQNFGIINYMYQ